MTTNRLVARDAAWLAEAFEHAVVGMALLDSEGRYVRANPAFCRLLGLTEAELRERSWRDLTHPEDLALSSHHAEQIASGQVEGYRIEKRYLHASGEPVWVQLTVSALRDERGAVRFFFSQIQDIRDRKQAERALRESEERFRGAFFEAPIGVALMEAGTGRYLVVNRALCDILGRGEEELLSSSWRDITHPDDLPEGERWAELVRKGEVRSLAMQKRYLRPHGGVVWAAVSTSVVQGSGEEAPYGIVHVQDITPLKVAQEGLEALVRSKDELVAAVSHELRTPLTAVVGLAESLCEAWEELEPGEALEFVRLVRDQAAEAAELVEDLLVAARAEAGELSVTSARVDLEEEVRRVLAGLPGGAGRGIRVQRRGGADAWADPTRVRQVLRNLLTNALRYGGERIRVVVEGGGETAAVEVRDDGPGIPEHRRELIFHPYQRGSQERVLAESVGLGLAVSARLATLMGGSLHYRYEEGESVFRLALPTEPDPS